MPDQQEQLKSILDATSLPAEAKAQAWDHFFSKSTADPGKFKTGLDSLQIDEPVKHQIWNLRFQAPATTGRPPQKSELPDQVETGQTFFGELGSAINPLNIVKGIGNVLTDLPGTVKNIGNASLEQGSQAIDAFKQGRYSESFGHALGTVPILGPAAVEAGEAMGGTPPKYNKYGEVIESGHAPNVGAGLGKGLGMILGVTGPGMASKIKAPKFISEPVSRLQESAGTAVYRGALKPPVAKSAQEAADIKDAVKYGLEKDLRISEKGVLKNRTNIDDLNSQVEAKIATNPNAPIDPADVASRMTAPRDKFSYQSTPADDLSALASAEREMMDTWGQGGPVPAYVAQKIKKGTYAKAVDMQKTAYDSKTGAAVSAQKALARGWKEELEKHFPDIKKLNAEEGTAIELQEMLMRAAEREANVGLGVPIARATPRGMGASALNAVVRFPELRSRLGIALYKGSQKTSRPLTMPAALAKVNLILGDQDEKKKPVQAEESVDPFRTAPPPQRNEYVPGGSQRRSNPFPSGQ